MTPEFFSSVRGYRIQKTLTHPVEFEGIALHSGVVTKARLVPAPANSGIRFERMDLSTKTSILARASSVVSTALATSLGNPEQPEAKVGTVEHLMAALYGMGISNLGVQVWGPEIPILDGSAGQFVDGILEAGITFQPYTMPVLRVLKPIKIHQEGAICELLPRERLRLTTSIDFLHPSIGLQTAAFELTPGTFRDEICGARTFGFLSDVTALKQRQLALGATIENVLAFSDDGVLNPEGMRYSDECVRHKTLDAVGDLALSGCWLEAEMVSFRGGHSSHLSLLNALYSQKDHWRIIPAEFLGTSVQSPSIYA